MPQSDSRRPPSVHDHDGAPPHDHEHEHDEHEHDEHDRGLAYDLARIAAIDRRWWTRRRLLGVVGGAGALVLAACGSSTKKAAAPTTTSAGSTTTASGSTTTGSADAGAGAPPPGAPPGGQGGPPPGGQGGPPPGGQGGPPPGGGPGGGEGGQPADGTIPQETAGPYPGDGSNGPNALNQSGIVRRDITSSLGSSTNVAGVPLTVRLKLTKGVGGAAFAGAAVYLWHCDAEGRYSMYSQGVTNETFLRGVQEADANGEVTFTTIYPGCYAGRWPHIHYEVYPTLAGAKTANAKIATSQLAFTEATAKAVYATKGYTNSTKNLAGVSLTTDMVFADGVDRETPAFTGDAAGGYTATLTVPLAT